jgi:hypothetical protein
MPASNALVRTILPAVIGVVIGGGAVAYSHKNDATSAAGSRATGVASSDARDELDALGADVARLKTNAPSQAAGLPYLRPTVPTTPAQSIINFDGAATWPQ